MTVVDLGYLVLVSLTYKYNFGGQNISIQYRGVAGIEFCKRIPPDFLKTFAHLITYYHCTYEMSVKVSRHVLTTLFGEILLLTRQPLFWPVVVLEMCL